MDSCFDLEKLIEVAEGLGIEVENEYDEREVIERIVSILILEETPKYSIKYREYYLDDQKESINSYLSLHKINVNDFIVYREEYLKKVKKLNEEYLRISKKIYYEKYKLMRKFLKNLLVFQKNIEM